MATARTDPNAKRDLRRVLDSDEFIDMISIGLIHQNQHSEITDYNRAALELLGLTSDEITGRNASDPRWAAVHEDGSPYLDEDNPAVVTLRTGERCVDVVMGIENPDRARRWISINTHPVLSDGAVTGVVVAFTDVSDRVQKERLLTLITAVNRFAMFAEDEDDLFQCVCDLLVDRGGYALAWIGVENGENIDILGAAGATNYLFEDIISPTPNTVTGGGPGGTALQTGVVQVANGLHELPSFGPWRDRASTFGLESALCIPFTSRRSSLLCVYDRHIVAFDPVTVRGIEDIAREVEFGITHLRSVEQLKRALDAIGGLTETRDPYTQGHQLRVGLLGEAIALQLGLDQTMARLIRQSGEVHDVGKISIPAEILTRPGQLGAIEFELVKDHCRVGSEILARASVPWPIAETVLQHHERLDGSGYPSGLSGDQIILPARIIAVADAIEAMAHFRPYRPSLGLEVALAEVERRAGTEYDSDVVAACRAVFEDGFSFPE